MYDMTVKIGTMYCTTIDKMTPRLLKKSNVESGTMIYSSKPDQSTIVKAYMAVKIVKDNLQDDFINHCRGILISGDAILLKQVNKYMVLNVINGVDIFYAIDNIDLININYDIRDRGDLFVGYKWI